MFLHLLHLDGLKVMPHFMEEVMPQELWVIISSSFNLSYPVIQLLTYPNPN